MGVCRGVKTGANPGGAIEVIASLKTYKLTLFTIVCNSENSIRNTRLLCYPLFCHRSVVKYILSLLKYKFQKKFLLKISSLLVNP